MAAISPSSGSTPTHIYVPDEHIVSVTVGAILSKYKGIIAAVERKERACIDELKHLVTKLDLRDYHFTEEHLRDIATAFPRLTEIDLRNSTLDGKPISKISSIQTQFFPNHTNLRILFGPQLPPSFGCPGPIAANGKIQSISSAQVRKIIEPSEKKEDKPDAVASATAQLATLSLNPPKAAKKKKQPPVTPLDISLAAQSKEGSRIDLRSIVIDLDNYSWAEKLCKTCPNTEFLHMPTGAVLDEKLGRILQKGLKALKGLDVCYCNFTKFDGLPCLSQLEQLFFNTYETNDGVFSTEEEIRELGANLKKKLAPAEAIQKLSRTIDTRVFQYIAGLKKLILLAMSEHTNIADHTFKQLVEHSSLQDLKVHSYSLTDQVFTKIKESHTLKRFCLYGVPAIGDAAIKALTAKLPQLTDLCIEAKKCSNAIFSDLQRLQHLRSLYLCDFPQVTTEGWLTLAQNCPGLQRLTVATEATKLTDALLDSWHTLNLQFCRIEDPLTQQFYISQAAITRFKAALPNCKTRFPRST